MQKLFPPTPRRIQRAIQAGDVPRSPTLTRAALLLAGLAAAGAATPAFTASLREVAAEAMQRAVGPAPSTAEALGLLGATVEVLRGPVLAALGGAWLVGALVGLLQVGPVFTPGQLAPSLERLRPPPLGGALRAEQPLWAAARPLVILGGLGGAALALAPEVLALAATQAPGAALVALGHAALLAALAVTGALLLVGIGDYLARRARWFEELHMTRAEAEQERRDQEVNPHVRRQLQGGWSEALPQGGLDALPLAALVLHDGRRGAVALAWAPQHAPRVTARAEGPLAAALLEAARLHRRVVHIDPDLTRTLLSVALDAPIPPALFEPVARLLILYGLTGRG